MATSMKNAAMFIEDKLAEAAKGNTHAYFELGVAYSTGTDGAEVDMIEAHKWFNLAAVYGHEQGKTCRAEISEEMSAREIAEAQRQARAWIDASRTSRAA